jgi:hypothetical protein
MKYYLGLLGAARISRALLAKETGEVIASIIAPPVSRQQKWHKLRHLVRGGA